MQTLKVDLGERSYPIHIGEGLLDQPELLAPHIAGRQVAIISNETVAPLYLERLSRSLAAYSVISVVLPDGEAHKNWETLQLIFDGLLSARHDRRTTVIALGGGVIGDMAGFAAACYQRGVDFIQVPTTLLSQVDSSVGGKTGINHPLGKNMVGAFYQPQVVLIDTATLNTLPPRELSAGLAEVIKYGLICDEPFLAWLEEHVDALRALDQVALTEAISRSCAAKALVVDADERESGVRATLNLGHTFGHAIETHMGYGVWLHGEAVAAGTVMALEMSATPGLDQRSGARSWYPPVPARRSAGCSAFGDDRGGFPRTYGNRQESDRRSTATGAVAPHGRSGSDRRLSERDFTGHAGSGLPRPGPA